MEVELAHLKTRHAALRPLVWLSVAMGIVNALLKLFLPFGLVGKI